MLYLDTPPPAPHPVEIRDIGGLVSDYEKQTRRFQSQDREVRLLYCRSACTMALRLPKACVYPHSKLFFHMAYNPRTGERRSKESAELFAMYPAKVRARLGALTPQNQMLTGTELIALGVPECGTQTMVARATIKPKPVTVASADPGSPTAAAAPGKSGPSEAAKKQAPPSAAVSDPNPKPKAVTIASADPESSTVAALVEKAMKFTGSALPEAGPQQPRPTAARVDPAPAKPKRAATAAADPGPATTASIPPSPSLLDTATDAAKKVSSKVIDSVLSLFR